MTRLFLGSLVCVIVLFGIFTIGCFEDEGEKLIITAHLSEPDDHDENISTYNYAIDGVKNGHAYWNKFSFTITDAAGTVLLDGMADFIGLDGSAIQYANLAGEMETVEETDFFILVIPTNGTGGRMKVFYEDVMIHDFDL